MRRTVLVLVALALACALVGCNSTGSPEIAAKDRLNALVALDSLKLNALNCSDLTAQLHTTLADLSAQVMGQDVKMNLAYPAVKLTQSDGNAAQVQVKAQIVAAMDMTVQVFSLNDTWNMIRESGQWKYCGSAISHTFARGDLARFVLQPGDSGAALTQKRSTDDVSQVFSLAGKEFEPFAPLAQETRQYNTPGSQDSYQVLSHAVLFKDQFGASQAFLQLSKTMIVDGCGNRKDLRVENLGEEGMGYSLSDHNWNYIWRSGNVVMYLEVAGDVFSPFSERDARALVEKIQARVG